MADPSAIETCALLSKESRPYSLLVQALRYLKGRGVDKDSEEAVRLLLLAAAKGSSVAFKHLASCIYKGNGCSRDKEEAVRLLRLGCTKSCSKAQHALAWGVKNGYGTEKNQRKAFRMFKRLAESGSVAAMCEMGICFHNGDGVRKSYFERCPCCNWPALWGVLSRCCFSAHASKTGSQLTKTNLPRSSCTEKQKKQAKSLPLLISEGATNMASVFS